MVDLLEWAVDRPLFTLNEAQRATGMQRPSLREKLSRMAKRGEVRRVERGKYTVHDDSMVYATYVEVPSFVSLWTGLRFYDLTTQQPSQVQVMVAEYRRDLDGIAFFRSNRLFGFGKEPYDRFEIFVADRERLLVDCLSRDRVPVDELEELVRAVDPDRAAEYAVEYGRHAVMKRVGYLLEYVRGVTIEDLRVRDRNYPVLDLTRPVNGETDSDWRLRVNIDAV